MALPVLSEDEKLRLNLERDRLLCDLEFARSPTMSKLLRFMVDHRLQGEGKPLTAYSIAVQALGRDDSFDTQIDSYPRVQIGRLRRMLDHFYRRENGGQRLSIPYQRYEILIGPNEGTDVQARQSGDAPQDSRKTTDRLIKPQSPKQTDTGLWHFVRSGLFSLPVIILVAAVMMFAIGYLLQLQQVTTPSVAAISYPTIDIQSLAGGSGPTSSTRVAMIHDLIEERFERFDHLRILDEDSNMDTVSRYSFETAVLNQAADRVQFRLVDNDTREIIWLGRIDVGSIQKLEADLDTAVAAIASPHGKIAQHEFAKFRGDYTIGYPCLLQFQQYMRYPDVSALRPVSKCLQETARRFPDDSFLMTRLAIAQTSLKSFDGRDENIDPAKAFATKAVKLKPNSASATFAVAQSAFLEGDCRRGLAMGERAILFNPLNSEITGYLGLYMLGCDMPEGEAYAEKALLFEPNSDPAVIAAMVLYKLRRGEVRAAQQLAARYRDFPMNAVPGLATGYILATATLGNKDEARNIWLDLVKRSGLQDNAAPRAVLGKWIANPVLVRALDRNFAQINLY